VVRQAVGAVQAVATGVRGSGGVSSEAYGVRAAQGAAQVVAGDRRVWHPRRGRWYKACVAAQRAAAGSARAVCAVRWCGSSTGMAAGSTAA